VHAAQSLAGAASRSHLDECLTLLERAGAHVRSMALELRPIMLETAGLDATLRWLAERHEQQTGIATQVAGHSGEVPAGLAIAGFRVVQEALTNAVRHAQARHVWIELHRSDTALELVVRDDGVGFDVPGRLAQAANEGHLGLLGMRERVALLAGTVAVDSTPGHGTRIHVSLPLSKAAADPPGPGP
jgi:signal transduction histidine kinase